MGSSKGKFVVMCKVNIQILTMLLAGSNFDI